MYSPAKHRYYAKRYRQNRNLYLRRSRLRYKNNKLAILQYQKIYTENHQEQIKAYRLIYRKNNRAALCQRDKLYRIQNKEQCKVRDRTYYYKNRLAILCQAKSYRMQNHHKITQQLMRRYYQDTHHRLKVILRSRLRLALRLSSKRGSAVRDLGCTISELKNHLEGQFQPGMTWDNWKHNGWHIDHIIPLASFNLTNRIEFLKACHFTNLQPLWAQENMRKAAHVSTL